eukprot:scaffold897_cov402-Prasinococcus_capsulatus_cf.AAC.13
MSMRFFTRNSGPTINSLEKGKWAYIRKGGWETISFRLHPITFPVAEEKINSTHETVHGATEYRRLLSEDTPELLTVGLKIQGILQIVHCTPQESSASCCVRRECPSARHYAPFGVRFSVMLSVSRAGATAITEPIFSGGTPLADRNSSFALMLSGKRLRQEGCLTTIFFSTSCRTLSAVNQGRKTPNHALDRTFRTSRALAIKFRVRSTLSLGRKRTFTFRRSKELMSSCDSVRDFFNISYVSLMLSISLKRSGSSLFKTRSFCFLENLWPSRKSSSSLRPESVLGCAFDPGDLARS